MFARSVIVYVTRTMLLGQIQWILSALLDWKFYLIISILYVVIFYIRVACGGLPSGPLPLPLLGNLPQLGRDIHLSFSRIRRNYKDVFTVYIVNQPVVILTSYEAVREAFVANGDKTSGRPSLSVVDIIHQGNNGKYTTLFIRSIFLPILHKDSGIRLLVDLKPATSCMDCESITYDYVNANKI